MTEIDTKNRARSRDRALFSVSALVNSASNGLLVVALSRLLGVHEFGAASIVYTAVVIVSTLGRAAWGETVLLAGHGDLLQRFERPLSLLLPISTGAALVLATHLDVGPAVVLATAGPLAVFAELARYRALAANRPKTVLSGDVVWLALVAISLSDAATGRPYLPIHLWALGAGIVGLLAQHGRPPVAMRSRSNDRQIRRELIVEAVLMLLATNGALVVAGATHGTEAVGSLRLALTLFGVGPIIMSAVYMREAIDHRDGSGAATSRLRLAMRISSPGLVGVAGVGVALLVIPSDLVARILGESGIPLRDQATVAGVAFAFVTFWGGCRSVLRMLHLSKRLTVGRLLGGLGALAGIVAGGAVEIGLLPAFLVGQAIAALTWTILCTTADLAAHPSRQEGALATAVEGHHQP